MGLLKAYGLEFSLGWEVDDYKALVAENEFQAKQLIHAYACVIEIAQFPHLRWREYRRVRVALSGKKSLESTAHFVKF